MFIVPEKILAAAIWLTGVLCLLIIALFWKHRH